MQSWLRMMAIPHILCRRCTPWSGRRHECFLPLWRPVRRIASASAPRYSAENADDDPYPGQNGRFGDYDGFYKSQRVVRQQRIGIEDRWHHPAATAEQFAAHLSSPQSDAHAVDIQSWFTVAQDDGKLPLRNAAYYSQLSEHPFHTQYPELPPTLFQRPPDPSAATSLYSHLKTYGEVQEEEKLVKRPECYVWRLEVTVHLADVVLVAQGEERTKEGARIGASMDLIRQLHETKKLEALIGLDWTKLHMEAAKVSHTAAIKAAPQMKLQVYNYAARFGQIPIFEFQMTKDGLKICATVSVPQIGMQAKAAGSSEQEAEVLACVALKRRAEEQQKADPSYSTMSFCDANTVNLDNAEDILAYYEFTHPDGEFLWSSETVRDAKLQSMNSCRVLWHQAGMSDKALADAVTMPNASQSKRLASLVAAVILVRDDPGLLKKFQQSVKENSGVVPRRISPISIGLKPNVATILEEIINSNDVHDFLADPVDPFHTLDSQGSSNAIRRLTNAIDIRDFKHMTRQTVGERSRELKIVRDIRRHDPQLVEIESLRSQLPVNQRTVEILSLIKNNPQCVIVGTAGSGKSTQIPQIILDDAIATSRGAFCNIICTQPRRVAAVTLALRVCQERGEQLGEVVGYRISGEAIEAELGGSITFSTAELLVLQLENAPDQMLNHVSHIIVDEVHERGDPTDRLLMTIKLVFGNRLRRGLSVPKLILMSATVQDTLFQEYFEMTSRSGVSVRPPLINIPTRQFPIKNKYLEDILAEQEDEQGVLHTTSSVASQHAQMSQPSTTSKSETDESAPIPIAWESQFEQQLSRNDWLQHQQLVASTLAHVTRTTEDGSILVFLAGWKEIKHMHTLLLQKGPFLGIDFTDQDKYQILLLHSSYPEGMAEALMDPPEGVRRVLLATNTAETSLTLVDVQYVVDSGKHRLLEYSDRKPANTFYRKWISRSNVAQRAGRVGRVQPGEYYGVYSQEEHMSMTSYPQPPALDSGMLQLLCLRARLNFPRIPIHTFFSKWLSPPPPRDIDAALACLKNIGALAQNYRITSIGQALCRLNVSPSTGKMILLGVLFRCLDPVLASAAVLSKDMPLYEVPEDHASEEQIALLKRQYAVGTNSDVISTLNAHRDFSMVRNERGDSEAAHWAEQKQMLVNRFQGLEQVSTKLEALLARLQIFDRWERDSLNTKSNHHGLIKALLFVGLYPNMAVHDEGYRYITRRGIPVSLSIQSVLRPSHGPGKTWEKNPLRGTLCSYTSVYSVAEMESETLIGGASPVSPLAAALFCSSLTLKEGDDSTLIIDGWIPLHFAGGPKVAEAFLGFKEAWDQAVIKAMTVLCQSKPMYRERERQHIRVFNLLTQTLDDLFEQEERHWRKKSGWS